MRVQHEFRNRGSNRDLNRDLARKLLGLWVEIE
jgi:hypothetical protein